jgi:ribose/xylose/arabinose/galactoside ABC-type transport system permease subunit
MNVSPFYQLIAKGGVIVLAVLVDQAIKAGAGRSVPAAPAEDRGEQRAHSG